MLEAMPGKLLVPVDPRVQLCQPVDIANGVELGRFDRPNQDPPQAVVPCRLAEQQAHFGGDNNVLKVAT